MTAGESAREARMTVGQDRTAARETTVDKPEQEAAR